MNPLTKIIPLVLGTCVLASCGDEAPPAAPAPTSAPAVTNRVDIPVNVRQNLGITFAKVESRPVTRTLRLPGAFELLPTATREYRAPAAGRVEVLVRQYDRVEPNQPLYTIESPRLREVQQQMSEAASALAVAQVAVETIPPLYEAHERHHSEIERSVSVWSERVAQLNEVKSAGGGQAAELAAANAALAESRAAFAETQEKEAELGARKADAETQLRAAKQRSDLMLATLSSLAGVPAEALRQNADDGTPRWQTLNTIEVRAAAAGVVNLIGISNGGFADASANVLTVIAPDQVRFRARGYQSDLSRLTPGLVSRVVPPSGVAVVETEPMTGTLVIAPAADNDSRTIELLVSPAQLASWSRPGVSGFLEVTLAGSAEPELAVPMACVVRDGLMPILFRRDPRDADKVIRMEAEVGANDGRWIVIKSGVAEGNEIVQDGAYQLLVATSGTIQKGGHFHPDGTFHEGTD